MSTKNIDERIQSVTFEDRGRWTPWWGSSAGHFPAVCNDAPNTDQRSAVYVDSREAVPVQQKDWEMEVVIF